MSTNVVLADGVQPADTSITTLYTAAANITGTRIVAFTAYNPAGSSKTYTVYIVPNGGTAGDENAIIKSRSLATLSSEALPEVINQLIPPGGTLKVDVSVGATIAFRASGIEF